MTSNIYNVRNEKSHLSTGVYGKNRVFSFSVTYLVFFYKLFQCFVVLSKGWGGTPHKRQLVQCFEITCTGCEVTRTPCELTRTHTCESTFTIRAHVKKRDNSHTLFSPYKSRRRESYRHMRVQEAFSAPGTSSK